MIKDFVGKIRGGSAKQKKAELAGLRKNRNQGPSRNEGAGNSGESLHIPEWGGDCLGLACVKLAGTRGGHLE